MLHDALRIQIFNFTSHHGKAILGHPSVGILGASWVVESVPNLPSEQLFWPHVVVIRFDVMAWHGGIPVRRNRKFVLYLIAACLALLIVSFRSLVLSHSSQIDNHHTDEQSAIQFHETIDATGTSVSEPNSAQFRPASDAASTLSVETTTIANGECGRFSNADDVLMILKTGVTVAHKRLPAHLKGTFRCTPKYLIFSDFSETINSHRIHNVFEAVDLAAQLSMPEFELYSFLQENPNRLSEVLDDPSHSTNGWRLDRWKFLPLLQKTWEAYQEAKWYLIIEGDTAVVWSNLLRWLSTLDSKEPIYLGLSQEVGPHHFALGGTGIILSRAALQRAVEWIPSRLDDYNQFTQAVMYGDITLGRVFEDAGITLRNGGSLFESNSISSVAYSPTTWCRPFVTMHHMQPDEIYSLWEVEQQLLNEKVT